MVNAILRDTGQHRSIIQFDFLYPSWRSADDLAILASNSCSSSRRKKQSLNPVDLHEAQGSRHAREPKSRIRNLGIFDGGIRDPGLWNSNPRHRIQNPGLSCIPLNGATEKAMLSPQISRNWNSLMTLYLCLGSVNSNEGGFREDVNKQGHPTTVFSQISVRRTKNCLEFSIAWWRLNISWWPLHSLIHGTFFEAYLIPQRVH